MKPEVTEPTQILCEFLVQTLVLTFPKTEVDQESAL